MYDIGTSHIPTSSSTPIFHTPPLVQIPPSLLHCCQIITTHAPRAKIHHPPSLNTLFHCFWKIINHHKRIICSGRGGEKSNTYKRRTIIHIPYHGSAKNAAISLDGGNNNWNKTTGLMFEICEGAIFWRFDQHEPLI